MNDELERILSTPPRLRHGMAPHVSIVPSAEVRRADPPPPVPEPVAVETAATPESAPQDAPIEPPTPEPVILQATGLKKSYRKGQHEVAVLKDVSLNVHTGEFVAIVGQSGCGKSTLLHLLGTLDHPDGGEIRFEDRRIDNLSARERDTLRNRQIGMIFQFYHLLPELTTLQNVLAPIMIAESLWQYFWKRSGHQAAAKELLRLVGLEHRLRHRPCELSGGEMQRAAIARSLIARPRLLLADEPTGNLDHETGEEIMRILRTLNREQNLTIVMVTHDMAIARQANRIVRLADGRVV
jgi:lipoprotein-releasing system ATP-binding protein